MNTKIEQLRKEIADKQKELELLQQLPYDKGQLVYLEAIYEWIAEFNGISDGCFNRIESICISSGSVYSYRCDSLYRFSSIKTHRLATEADLNRLPDGHKWKPKKLPTTIEEIYIANGSRWFPSRICATSEENVARVIAYRDLLEVIEWGNREWPDDNRFIKQCGMPATNSKTLRHIETYFAHDLETFQY